jgi:Putative cyclase
VITTGAHGRDDRLDGLYPQFSSQWDGLRHVRFRGFGFWGGRQDEDVDTGGQLGIEHWSRHGLISRGVLLDVAGYCARAGRPLLPDRGVRLEPDLLDAVATAEQVNVEPGDVLLIRTGWVGWYLTLDTAARRAMVGAVGRRDAPLACPGLASGPRTAAWLWDHQVAAVAADNPTVEVLPVDRTDGFLHYRLIPLLGMALGELWALDALAAACRDARRYSFLLTSGVLDLPGGVGSPANAYAVL